MVGNQGGASPDGSGIANPLRLEKEKAPQMWAFSMMVPKAGLNAPGQGRTSTAKRLAA